MRRDPLKPPPHTSTHPCVEEIKAALAALGDPAHALVLARYFQARPGGYGDGDRFLGIRVPQLRRLARRYPGATLEDAGALLASPVHEERFVALLIMMAVLGPGTQATRRKAYLLYLRSTRRINNWDLVDVSAPHIIGAYLKDKDKAPLYRLARSSHLWERRMAVLATFHYIKDGDFDVTLRIAAMLLGDPEDLIHKAAGWMLREVGNRDRGLLEEFLKAHAGRMPRVMLRYSIERFPASLRKRYLRKKPGGPKRASWFLCS